MAPVSSPVDCRVDGGARRVAFPLIGVDALLQGISMQELHPLKQTHFSPATVVHFVAALDSRTLHHATGRYHNATLEIHRNCSDWGEQGLGEDGVQGMVGVAASQAPCAEQGSQNALGVAPFR